MALAGIACGGFLIWRRRKHQRVGRSFPTTASLALAAACLANGPLLSAPITIDWVTVGNQGNANDATGYGAVSYEYRVGKYEVTIQQYTDFLNAVAATDTYSLYNTRMASDLNIAGISRAGTSGSYTYSVINNGGNSANRPITYVSWFDAARFANWMQNGQGSGSTETGAYTLVGGQTSGTAPSKNPGAQFYIPTENEWYKAAYFSPLLNSGSGGYYYFATLSNTTPGNTIGSGANQANYWLAGVYSVTQSSDYDSNQNYITDVGAFSSSASYYGTFDQTGNVPEWNDLTGAAGTDRGWRGGDWGSNQGAIDSYMRRLEDPSFGNGLGFRLASPVAVPEPSTYAMALAGLACGGYSMWRRLRGQVISYGRSWGVLTGDS
jgi:formylglycine-generating enzyme required for sulfatase activity